MRNAAFALVTVVVVALVLATFIGRSATPTVSPTVSPTDLVIGQAYKVADFQSCKLADGSLATEWHFGGADRSRRNQLTPSFDGHGRNIFRVVTNYRALPAGYMRLRPVTEFDPILEGFSYGTYHWSGLVVEYNGRVEPQAVVGPCGTPRS